MAKDEGYRRVRAFRGTVAAGPPRKTLRAGGEYRVNRKDAELLRSYGYVEILEDADTDKPDVEPEGTEAAVEAHEALTEATKNDAPGTKPSEPANTDDDDAKDDAKAKAKAKPKGDDAKNG